MYRRASTFGAIFLALIAPVSSFASSQIGPTFTASVLSANFDADVIGQSPNTTLPGAPTGDFLTLNQTAGTVVVESQVDGLTKPAHLKQNNSPGGV